LGGDAEPLARIRISFLAASRTRARALSVRTRPCVRRTFCELEFPLASPLPSTASAAGRPALFGSFAGTMGLSDFPVPFIVGLGPWTSRRGPWHHPPRAVPGPPGSRARCFRACRGSSTASGPGRLAKATTLVLPVVSRDNAGARNEKRFRGSIARLHVPLSTLHPRPRERRRMTRGRCGSLFLHRMGLSPLTPCRFIPAHPWPASSSAPLRKAVRGLRNVHSVNLGRPAFMQTGRAGTSHLPPQGGAQPRKKEAATEVVCRVPSPRVMSFIGG